MKQATKDNQKTLEQIRDHVEQLLRSILKPVYSQSRNMILPPALEADIVQFAESVKLYSNFNDLSDI